MSSDDKALEAAKWLIVAFAKCWTWGMFQKALYDATGKQTYAFQFLPVDSADGKCWAGKVLVRSYVAQNWPNLFNFLDGHGPEKQLACAGEIVKLRWNGGRPLGSINSIERLEILKTRKDLRVATTSYRQSRKEFTQNRVGTKRGVAR